jgi:hypothetical protein
MTDNTPPPAPDSVAALRVAAWQMRHGCGCDSCVKAQAAFDALCAKPLRAVAQEFVEMYDNAGKPGDYRYPIDGRMFDALREAPASPAPAGCQCCDKPDLRWIRRCANCWLVDTPSPAPAPDNSAGDEALRDYLDYMDKNENVLHFVKAAKAIAELARRAAARGGK